MSALFRLFLDICLFRKAPQDVPYSPFLLGGLIGISIIVQFFASIVFAKEEKLPGNSEVLFFVIVTTILMTLVVYLLVLLLGFRRRAVQALTSLHGTDLVWLPVYISIEVLRNLVPSLGPLVLVLAMVAIGWRLAIHANIYRHVLSISVFTAGFLAIGLLFLEIVIDQFILQGWK